MKNDAYTVKQVARMAGGSRTTFHHYDAIGLLRPLGLSAANYRLYGREQLERLQQILFYRELGFPLKDIHQLLNGSGVRLDRLRAQRQLLLRKQTDVARLIATIERTIACAEGGHDMPDQTLFEGFHTEAEWNAALAEHNAHLKSRYGAAIPPVRDADEMNAAAAHAKAFTSAMARALTEKEPVTGDRVHRLVRGHVDWLIAQGHIQGPEGFAQQTSFFLNDDFHRDMLESQQPGLSYYLDAAARAFASS